MQHYRKAILSIPEISVEDLKNILYSNYSKSWGFPMINTETYSFEKNGGLVKIILSTLFDERYLTKGAINIGKANYKIDGVLDYFLDEDLTYKSIFTHYSNSKEKLEETGGLNIQAFNYEYVENQIKPGFFIPVSHMFCKESVPNWNEDHTRDYGVAPGIDDSVIKISSYLNFMSEYYTPLSYTRSCSIYLDVPKWSTLVLTKEKDKSIKGEFTFFIEGGDDVDKFKPVYAEQLFDKLKEIGLNFPEDEIEKMIGTIKWPREFDTYRLDYVNRFSDPFSNKLINYHDSFFKDLKAGNEEVPQAPVEEKKTEVVFDPANVKDFLRKELKLDAALNLINPDDPFKKELENYIGKNEDDVEFTKTKLKMIHANDLFKDKWLEIETEMKKSAHCYVITPKDLVEANRKIKKGIPGFGFSYEEEEKYFEEHFDKRTMTPTDFEIWGKIGGEWLESGNDITPIPTDGSEIKVTDLIHTLQFAPPLNLDKYLDSKMFGQKDIKWGLSGNIENIVNPSQKNILPDNSAVRNEVEESWKEFKDKYTLSDSLFPVFDKDKFLTDYSEKIKNYFMEERFAKIWETVLSDLKLNYVISESRYGSNPYLGKGGFKYGYRELTLDILDKIFGVHPKTDKHSLSLFDNYLDKKVCGYCTTLNEYLNNTSKVYTWEDELSEMVNMMFSLDEHMATWQIQLASKLIKYAFLPSQFWSKIDLNDLRNTRLKFDKKLLYSIYKDKWKEVIESISVKGKYLVTVEDLKKSVKDYYAYLNDNTKLGYYFHPDYRLKDIDDSFDCFDGIFYNGFEITQKIYNDWRSKGDEMFRESGIKPIITQEEYMWDIIPKCIRYRILDVVDNPENKNMMYKDCEKNINEDFIISSFMFVPPLCMETYEEPDTTKEETKTESDKKDDKSFSIIQKAVDAVRAIQEAAKEAVKSINAESTGK